MCSFNGFVLWVFAFVLTPIYYNVLIPIYGYVLRPIFLMINRMLGWVSWLYGFRATLMMQGLISYWRACLYFERSTLWETVLNEHRSEAKSYLVPLLWTLDGTFLVVVVLLVLVTAACGENNMRRLFNIQGRVGIKFYRVGKTIWELSVLRLMVYVGDMSADKSVAEIHIASFFSCIYLTVASLLKLCYVGNDLGLVDGIASLTLSAFTHYCKSEILRIGGFFICAFLIWVKNNMFTECCARCSQADQVVSELVSVVIAPSDDDGDRTRRIGRGGSGGGSGGDRGGGGSGGDRGGGGRGGGRGGGGGTRRRRGGSGENIGNVEEDHFYSARTSTQSAAF